VAALAPKGYVKVNWEGADCWFQYPVGALAEQIAAIAVCLALCVDAGLTKNVWARQYRTQLLIGTTSVILHADVGCQI
jgi:hypothetical protein